MSDLAEYPPLVRTRKGGTVHVATCPSGRTGLPWKWAEGLGWRRIMHDTAGLGVRFCRKCRPLTMRPYDDHC